LRGGLERLCGCRCGQGAEKDQGDEAHGGSVEGEDTARGGRLGCAKPIGANGTAPMDAGVC
jgi:hypothetical protein